MINLVLSEGWLQGNGLVIAFLDNGGIYLKVELQNNINGSIKINFLKRENCLAPGNAGLFVCFFVFVFFGTRSFIQEKTLQEKAF